ncbi:uncharacterized protein LOC129805544 [Phlebotomus papatasi]|uniref:uncharacterized protein LOC129805544 n=1 Tax=Phlebotomus papatasi TaxID=29031 RepID=UPI00248373CB|nr:uncharacterized protein LOC129805544 [Phlebotomus papatasi]
MEAGYTSVFEIDGKPILPPLMTDAIRMEMRQYRTQAIKLEERLKNMKQLARMNSSTLDSTQEIPDDLTQGYVTCKSFESGSDVVTEVEVVGDVEDGGKESPLFVPSGEGKNASKDCDDLALEELTSNLSISVPLVESRRISGDGSVPMSPPEKELERMAPVQRIVRSNSYTLEAPSPHLADLLKKSSAGHSPTSHSPNGQATNSRGPVDLKKVKSKVDSRLVYSKSKKISSKAGMKKALGNTPSSQISKHPRSSAIGKLKVLRVPKKADGELLKKPEGEEVKKEKVTKDESIPQNQNEISEFLSKIEAEHKVRMQELLELQLEEQRKFRETFNEQQKLLMESLRKTFPEMTVTEDSNGNDTTVTTPLSLDLGDSEWTNPSLSSSSSVLKTPKMRENSLDRVTQVFLKQHLTQVRQEQENLSPRSLRAASVINAHVRGYLVRRLMRTEAVHQIIQTFHDTRVFLIELHRDSQNKNTNSTDMELKRRLLQQLASSLGSLHEVFFQLPMKERMEIIAKDRENLFLRLQRASQRRSQSAESRRAPQQLNKMKIVAL